LFPISSVLFPVPLQATADESGCRIFAAGAAMCSVERQAWPQIAVSRVAVFLCSEAARNITGVPISDDGGWTAQ